jgi:hypothetical protein
MMDRPNFEAWWEEHGQYGRAGGGEYEKTFAYNAWVSQAERIRVLREVVEAAAAADEFCADAECRVRLAAMARAALEATND